MVFGAMLIGLAACEDPVDLGIELETPKLVVISNFSDLDTLEVVVSKSQSVLEESHQEYIPNAKVDIFLEDDFLETLTFVSIDNGDFPSFYRSNFIVPAEGQVYTIEVSAPGFEDVRAVNAIPQAVDLDSSSLNLDVSILQQDQTFNQFNFIVDLTINDPPGQENYYHVNFYQEGFNYKIDTMGDTLLQSFFSLPLLVEDEGGSIPLVPYIDKRGVLLDDTQVQGGTIPLSLNGSFLYRRNDQLLGDFIIELRSVSREYYLYHTSLARQYQSNLDPFSDPIILYNNIENGFGIFAGFVSRFYLLDAVQ
jgi:hypothetical protein